ncbi:hypothetical protein SprV_0100240300 [Sparganum proliferum]
MGPLPPLLFRLRYARSCRLSTEKLTEQSFTVGVAITLTTILDKWSLAASQSFFLLTVSAFPVSTIFHFASCQINMSQSFPDLLFTSPGSVGLAWQCWTGKPIEEVTLRTVRRPKCAKPKEFRWKASITWPKYLPTKWTIT